MPDLSHKQEEALEHETRKAIHEFLKRYDKPASLGEIDEAIEQNELANTHYHLDRLVEVELVEKISRATPGERDLFRVVER